MFIKIFAKANNYLTSAIIQKIQSIMIIGKMKDETCGLPIKRFVRLKAKMYSYIIEDDHECKKAKDIT